ncbi:hypothetical protein ACVW17_000278 [Bradyrhizobium sp. USDA 4473]
MPIAISVNMLRLRVTTDCQPRAKNGAPAHSTTGVASTNEIQFDQPIGTRCISPRWLPISSTNTGKVSARPIQNRRVISISSGSGPSSSETCSGSSAMPQIGQEPGPTWRTSGCIGQV